jgi:hypothetical protein
LRDLVVPAIGCVDGVGIDERERDGVIAGIFDVCLLSVQVGCVGELAGEADSAGSICLDLEDGGLA